ncbi:MAG: 50S ribosomal protein L23 [Deltaproteobacteria bacterium]|nr:50S ribosomal protein L23 [Deltaproteobacteria bacterium]
MNLYDVIRKPIVTEKAVAGQALQQYAFEVDPRATKPLIRQAIEKFFRVKVTNIQTQRNPGKKRRALRGRGQAVQLSDWKKAVVTLAEGQKLDFSEGV